MLSYLDTNFKFGFLYYLLEIFYLSIQMFMESSCPTGSEWHPQIRNDKNHFIYNDLPRFIMDSYEVCRDPPRLHLLDKYGYLHPLPLLAMTRMFKKWICDVYIYFLFWILTSALLADLMPVAQDLVWRDIQIQLTLREHQVAPLKKMLRKSQEIRRLVKARYHLFYQPYRHRILTILRSIYYPLNQFSLQV